MDNSEAYKHAWTTQILPKQIEMFWNISWKIELFADMMCMYIFCISYFQTFMTKVTQSSDDGANIHMMNWKIYIWRFSQNIEFNIILHIASPS